MELHDDNKLTYSHRIYELLLRTCTEFENNCKGILIANGYDKKNLNAEDYFKINRASKLSEYEVKINIWSPSPRVIYPFKDWDVEQYSPLSWYQDYNKVKHNRSENFPKANLENLLNAVAGLYVVLASQFAMHIFNPYQNTSGWQQNNDFYFTNNNVLSIKFPTWKETNVVKFEWEKLKEESNPFQQYNFN